MYGRVVGMPQDDHGVCYLPNAAIAWKQPNGFYYPPAFHSRNLYFDQDVDIRHFVIEPLFKPGTFQTNDTCRQGDGDAACVKNRYCTWVPTMFDNFTDIDRQTELNDDDGSLTGYVNTISVNEDHFFNAPIEAFECDSDLTAKTSPYDYVTTVVYPGCVAETEVARKCPTLPWGSDCGGPHCYGVPMYRQWLTREENESTDTVIKNPTIRLAGQGNFQRSTLSVNHGKYYIDTAVSEATQRAQPRVSSLNVFKENQTYYVFLVFAKATTRQTYQLFVGTHGFDEKSTGSLRMVRADVHTNAYTFKYPAWHDSPSPNPWKRSYDPTTVLVQREDDSRGCGAMEARSVFHRRAAQGLVTMGMRTGSVHRDRHAARSAWRRCRRCSRAASSFWSRSAQIVGACPAMKASGAM